MTDAASPLHDRLPEIPGDYFVVSGPFGSYCVSVDMARFIESELDRPFGRKWVTFVDVHGSRVRVRRELIGAVAQSTAAQRASQRDFFRVVEVDDLPDEEGEESWEE
ncbi:MAG: hypothetical protein NW201_12300 [Gemmatimonadales bacterium]|nr:hypothetical protein [Gemmatimonadales bacterium]